MIRGNARMYESASLPFPGLLINLVFRFATTLFKWQGVGLQKVFSLSHKHCWLVFWLKFLPKFSCGHCCTTLPSICFCMCSLLVAHKHTLAHVSLYFLRGCPSSMWVNFSLLISCLPPRQTDHYFLPGWDNHPMVLCPFLSPTLFTLSGFQQLRLSSVSEFFFNANLQAFELQHVQNKLLRWR